MKRSSTGGGGDGGKKQKGADFEGDFPRGKPSASDREDMKMKPQHKVVRKSEGESSLFKSEGARENQEAAAAELAKEKKKIRGKNLKATTAKRTARAKSDAKLTRGGEETEDLGDAWSEREMKLPKVVEPLRFKKVNEGMLLLGVVKEVREAEALISLPNNLSGWVEVDQVSDELENLIEESLEDEDAEPPALSDFLWVGLSVRCMVLSTAIVSGKGKQASSHHKHINVSVKPSLVNRGLSIGSVHVGMKLYGAVSAIEEHGYAVSLGNRELNAFLPFDEAGDRNGKLKVGQLVEGRVTKLQKGAKLAKLSLVPEEEAEEEEEEGKKKKKKTAPGVTKEVEDTSIDSLQPGMLVQCSVAKVLESGLVVRFLSSFIGTIDLFHLASMIPLPDEDEEEEAKPAAPQDVSATDSYAEKQKILARILYVDVGSKSVGLTLAPHILEQRPPIYHALGARIGQVFAESVIRRIDPGIGMVLSLPASSIPGHSDSAQQLQGWVHISNAADERSEKLEKSFKVGRVVPSRVTGFSWMDGVLNLTMKKSVVEASIIGLEDITPGQIIKAKVVTLGDKGCIVAVAEHVRGLVPPPHYADVKLNNPEKSLTIGKTLTLRVLTVDPLTRRLILSNKKSLVNSELPIIHSLPQCLAGTVGHGWVAKVQDNGLLISLFGKVMGFAMVTECGIDRDSDDIHECFNQGQVVKIRILETNTERGRLRLSLRTTGPLPPPSKKEKVDKGEKGEKTKKVKAVDNSPKLEIGSVVPVEVTSVEDGVVSVKAAGAAGEGAGAMGFLTEAHLSDHPRLGKALFAKLKVGFAVDAVVLQHEKTKQRYAMSAKPSIIEAARAGTLPSKVESVRPQQFLQGFVKGVAEYGVFVCFLDGLSALAPKGNLSNKPVASAADLGFTVGQSVRCCVVSVDAAKGRISITLKPSMCMCPDASFLKSLLEQQELLASASAFPGDAEPSKLAVGAVVKATVKDVKKAGVTFTLPDGGKGYCSKAALEHAKAAPVAGKSVKCVILDVNAATGMATLCLDAGVVAAREGLKDAKARVAASKGVRALDTVTGIIRGVTEDAVLLTLPAVKEAVVLAAAEDFNLRGDAAAARFTIGAELQIVVFENDASGRVLGSCGADLGQAKVGKGAEKEGGAGKKASKAEKAADEELATLGGGVEVAAIKVGKTLKGIVTALTPTHATLRLGKNVRGCIHVLDMPEGAEKLTKGQAVEARVTAVKASSAGKDEEHHVTIVDLSLIEKGGAPATLASIKVGDLVTGIVQEVKGGCVWVELSAALKGRVSALDASASLDVIQALPKNFPGGARVQCRVLSLDVPAGRLDLSMRGVASPAAGSATPGDKKKRKSAAGGVATDDIVPGAKVPVKVVKAIPGTGLVLQLGHGRFGRVGMCDVSDQVVEKPLALYPVGTYAMAAVLSSQEDKVDLSLRPSRTGLDASTKAPGPLGKRKGEEEAVVVAMAEVADVKELTVGQIVSGYVKSTSAAGCFVQLGTSVVARVGISQLSDGYVKDVKGFCPPGKLVTGRIIKVDEGKGQADMSLKRSVVSSAKRVVFSDVSVGQVVKGNIKSIQTFGVFVRLKNSDLTGLCHISEVSDKYVKDLKASFKEGDAVKAKVLRKDDGKQTISLGMKDEYFAGADEDDDEEDSDGEADGPMGEEEGEESDEEEEESGEEESGDEDDEEDDSEEEEEEEEEEDAKSSKAKGGSKMELDAEDGDDDDDAMEADNVGFDWDDFGAGKAGDADSEEESVDEEEEEEGAEERSKARRRKKKEQAAKEAELRRREDELVRSDKAPESAEEFERLVLASPRSSFVWIKYMALHLEMTEIDKAREVAERALKTIGSREEKEKFNVWVARLNLENMYGSRDQLMEVFQEACKVNDAKQMHLQLLTVLEKGADAQATEAFFKTATKKYRTSCKFWLRYLAFKLKGAHPEAAARLMDRATEALAKRKHLKLLTKFALLEYKSGSAARAASIFEGVLASYPKRLDLWTVYLDAELKATHVETARQILHRAVTLKLRARQAKGLFKRLLDLEREHGDEASIAKVKDMARAWVEENT